MFCIHQPKFRIESKTINLKEPFVVQENYMLKIGFVLLIPYIRRSKIK
jgi:hypothetical protein